MRETLIDFLMGQPDYQVKDSCLVRSDDSIVARCRQGKWVVSPNEREMVEYMACTGRGVPSMLSDGAYGDPTNPCPNRPQRRTIY